MITQYPIANAFLTQILQARPQGSAPLTVANLSTSVTVTINDSSNGNGFPLGPGASISWDADKALYAASSAPANLAVLDNAGTIDNPAVLAQLIVDSGLAQGIADRLTASTLASNIGTQTSTKVAVAGAPPRDIMGTVYDNSWFLPGPGPLISPVLDVSNYQSVFVKVRESLQANIAAPVPRLVTIAWYSSNAPSYLTAVSKDQFYVVDDSAGGGSDPDIYTSIQGPVRGPFMQITISATSNNPAATIAVTALGSYKSVPDTEYRLRSSYFGQGAGQFQGFADDNYAACYVGTKTTGLYTHFPHCKSGLTTVTFLCSTVSVAGNIFVMDGVNTNLVYAGAFFPVASSVQMSTQQFIMPNRPIRISMDTNMAGTGFRWALSYSAS